MTTIPNPGQPFASLRPCLRDLDHTGLAWAASCRRCRYLFTAVYHAGGYTGDAEARHECAESPTEGPA